MAIDPFLLYGGVVLVYLPGVIYLMRRSHVNYHPIVLFYFVGLLVFNAVGSIAVWFRFAAPSGVIYSQLGFALMLGLQAAIAYLVLGPYSQYVKRSPEPVRVTKADYVLLAAIAFAIVAILSLYYYEVRRFLVFDLVSGQMNADNVLEYRLRFTYGLKNYPYYRLGFVVLPAILASCCYAICFLKRRIEPVCVAGIALSFIASLLLGEKSGILYLVVVIAITHAVLSLREGRSLASLFRSPRLLTALALAIVPTVGGYVLYYSSHPIHGAFENILANLAFRMFGAYPEALAVIPPFVAEYGELAGLSLPNFKGLLSHDRYPLEVAMHMYISDPGAAHQVTSHLDQFAGAVLVPAAGEGYVNFGWPGFVLFALLSCLVVVACEEILLRMRCGVLSIALVAWYAYLAMNLSMTGLFATIVSLIHTAVAAALILAVLVTRTLVEHARTG